MVKARNKKYEFWGWKDPRTILTIELFLPYLSNPHFFTCHREPDKVAKSIKLRNGFPVSRGLELEKEYNDRLERFIKSWRNKEFQ